MIKYNLDKQNNTHSFPYIK